MIITLQTTCPCCGSTNNIDVEKKDYENYQNGTFCQTAFPYLTAGEREMIITGICDKCWKRIFS